MKFNVLGMVVVSSSKCFYNAKAFIDRHYFVSYRLWLCETISKPSVTHLFIFVYLFLRMYEIYEMSNSGFRIRFRIFGSFENDLVSQFDFQFLKRYGSMVRFGSVRKIWTTHNQILYYLVWNINFLLFLFCSIYL